VIRLRRSTALVAVAIVIVVLVVVGVLAFQQYQQRESLRNVQIGVDGVRVESVNLTSARLNFSLRITNPNTNAVTIDRTDYTVLINNISLGTGQNLERVTMPAGGSMVIPQPFTVSFSGAAQSVWSYLIEGEADYRLVGTAYFDTFLGTVGVPYDIRGTLGG
jgi:LEA14-like dessication related protein